MLKTACFLLAGILANNAVAENSARPDAADPKARVPVRPYEPALRDYRPYVDPDIARWRETNAEVGRLGGHIGHVPRKTGAAATPGAKPPAPMGHGGHK